MINDEEHIESRFPSQPSSRVVVWVASSGENDTLKQTRENESRKDAAKTCDAIYKSKKKRE